MKKNILIFVGWISTAKLPKYIFFKMTSAVRNPPLTARWITAYRPNPPYVSAFFKIIIIFSLVCCSQILLATSSEIYNFNNAIQQTRFANLTQQFRCLVCQNETLADSDAPLAKDLRGQIAQLIQKNSSDQQIKQYLVQRYGDFILFSPPIKNITYLLWFSPFLLLLVGLFIWLKCARRGNAKIAATQGEL